MNKIAVPLNIIANFITQNQVQKFTSTIKKIVYQLLECSINYRIRRFLSPSKRPTLCHTWRGLTKLTFILAKFTFKKMSLINFESIKFFNLL